jgi:hypothetical protein
MISDPAIAAVCLNSLVPPVDSKEKTP